MSRIEFPRKVKFAALKRAEGQCEYREGTGIDEWRCSVTSRLECDHIKAAEMGGEATLENCKVLCRAHHRKKTNDDIKVIAKSNRIRKRAWGLKKKRSITQWRRFNGDKVTAPRER